MHPFLSAFSVDCASGSNVFKISSTPYACHLPKLSRIPSKIVQVQSDLRQRKTMQILVNCIFILYWVSGENSIPLSRIRQYQCLRRSIPLLSYLYGQLIFRTAVSVHSSIVVNTDVLSSMIGEFCPSMACIMFGSKADLGRDIRQRSMRSSRKARCKIYVEAILYPVSNQLSKHSFSMHLSHK